MHCTNCGQEMPAGANVCPFCGAPAAQAAPPAAVPPVTVSMPPTTAAGPIPEMRGSSGTSVASLVLGILSILLVILSVILTYTFGASIIERFGGNPNISQSEIMRLAQDPAFQANAMGIFVCIIGALLVALIGFILGIVGIAGENRNPTRSGKTFSILGLVLSALPLLCCTAFFIIGLLGQRAG